MSEHLYKAFLKSKIANKIHNLSYPILDNIFYMLCNGFKEDKEQELINFISQIQNLLYIKRYKSYVKTYLKKWLYKEPINGFDIELYMKKYFSNCNNKFITEKQLKDIFYKIADLILMKNESITKQDIRNILKEYTNV